MAPAAGPAPDVPSAPTMLSAPAGPAPPAIRMPRPAAPRSMAIVSEVAMSVFDGTQSVSTQAPPSPSESTTVTCAPSWAATRAASYPPGPPPRITTLMSGCLTASDCVAAARCDLRRVIPADRPPRGAWARTLVIRGVVRGVWQQHGPGADGEAVPALAPARHGLAGGLAAHVRRRGRQLGRRARHRGGRRGATGVRGALRRPGDRRAGPGPLGRGHPRLLPQAAGTGGDARR